MSATRTPAVTPSRSSTRSASRWRSRVASSEKTGEMMAATGRSGAGNPPPAPRVARPRAATIAATRSRQRGGLTRASIPCERSSCRLRRRRAPGQTAKEELAQALLHLFGHLDPTGVGRHLLRLPVGRQIRPARCALREVRLEFLDVGGRHLPFEVLEDDGDQLPAVHRARAVQLVFTSL